MHVVEKRPVFDLLYRLPRKHLLQGSQRFNFQEFTVSKCLERTPKIRIYYGTIRLDVLDESLAI
jgi:hypothetical protein